MRDESKRQVKFKDALALATRLNIAGVVETSAKEANKTVGMIDDINDCFMITATSCFDFLNRQKLMNNILAQQAMSENASNLDCKSLYYNAKFPGIFGIRAGI